MNRPAPLPAHRRRTDFAAASAVALGLQTSAKPLRDGEASVRGPHAAAAPRRPWPPRAGASLLVVLGLLAVLTVLASAFALSMRAARLTGRNYADDVRSRHLVHTALVRAAENIDATMRGYCYPFWGATSGLPPDAMCSAPGGPPAADSVFRGREVHSMIPAALWPDTEAAVAACGWENVLTPDGLTNGRIAYVVVNASGLLDANYLAHASDRWASNIVDGLFADYDIVDPIAFYADAGIHARYETLAELVRLNHGVADPVSNLFVYSHDPGPDLYFAGTNRLGCPDVPLFPKLDINACTAYPGYADPAFLAHYWAPLTNRLVLAGFLDPEPVAWNIVNSIDADRVPQNASPYPWLDDAGVEAVPLVNEIVLHGATGGLAVTVELWFPFYPATVSSNDSFTLQIGVLTNGVAAPDPAAVMTAASVVSTHPIPDMAFGTASEFLCFTTPAFAAVVAPASPVGVVARVLQATNGPVDEAMGYTPSNTIACLFTSPGDWSVRDPRLNGNPGQWVRTTNATLGAMNSVCDPWADRGQGLPIVHRDGPMQGVGEVGYVHCPPSSLPGGAPWNSVDLLDFSRGAALLDWLTVRATNAPRHGLVSLSSQQRDVLRTLFHNVPIGQTNSAITTNRPLTDAETRLLADAFVAHAPFLNFRDAMDWLGYDPAFRAWAPDGVHTNGDLKEDAIRHLPELVTFRQNLFTVILAAQPLAPNGQPTAEKRALALLYRDSYTGKSFVRLFRWITD